MPLPSKTKTQTNVAPAKGGVNFMDDAFYSSGFVLPKGKWAMYFNWQMFKGEKSKWDAKLGVMATCHNLSNLAEEPHKQFFSLGTNAHKSFQPNENGTGLIMVPGGAQNTVGNMTAWDYFRKSLFDCGLPRGFVQDDISVLNGIWVETDQMPEPEERKAFKTQKTSEEDREAAKGPSMLCVAMGFVKGGRLWEGDAGGIPGQELPKTNGHQAAIPPAAAPPAQAEGIDPEQLHEVVSSAVTDVLSQGANAKGMGKLGLQVATLKALSSYGDDVAKAAADTYFSSAENLNRVLGPLGYKQVGTNIVIA